MDAKVLGEEDCVVGDLLNVTIRVDLLNHKPGEQSGYVHSKHYPYLRRDSWYLIITDALYNGLACVEKIQLEDSFFKKEF